MAEIMVRVLGESEWSLYRDVRLGALAESPGSFTASLAEESVREEQFWRDRMTRSHRLVAERGSVPLGIVSVGPFEDDNTAAEVFGLYVVPDARGTGVSWRLMEAAAARAARDGYVQLYFWVGTDNGRALVSRPTSGSGPPTIGVQRTAPMPKIGDQQIALVLWLEPDSTVTPNPTSGKAVTREGPDR